MNTQNALFWLLRYGDKHDGIWSECEDTLPEPSEAKRMMLCYEKCKGLTDDALENNIIEDILDLACVTLSFGTEFIFAKYRYRGVNIWEDDA